MQQRPIFHSQSKFPYILASVRRHKLSQSTNQRFSSFKERKLHCLSFKFQNTQVISFLHKFNQLIPIELNSMCHLMFAMPLLASKLTMGFLILQLDSRYPLHKSMSFAHLLKLVLIVLKTKEHVWLDLLATLSKILLWQFRYLIKVLYTK